MNFSGSEIFVAALLGILALIGYGLIASHLPF